MHMQGNLYFPHMPKLALFCEVRKALRQILQSVEEIEAIWIQLGQKFPSWWAALNSRVESDVLTNPILKLTWAPIKQSSRIEFAEDMRSYQTIHNLAL